jgi:uncharacterized protein (TIGR03790 family)
VVCADNTDVRIRPFFLALLAALTAPDLATAQSGENVLLVINAQSPASVEIGEYYVAKRSIPAANIIRISTAAGDAISRADYERTIESPLAAFLTRQSLQDQILYIVLTKDIPLRISGTAGRDGSIASVDSELTLLYRKLLGVSPPVVGRIANPLFLGERDLSAAKPVTRYLTDIYLVTRLDGFTTADAKGLIDRSVAATPTGTFVLDQKATIVDAGGDAWLETAAERLKAVAPKNQVLLEATRAIAAESAPVLGYYSWGSNDPANQLRDTGLTFAPGAIGGTYVSTDGRTLVEPPATWKPSAPSGGPVFRGSFQSLAGDLIRDGLTGVAAHVNEPYLDATVRPQILFPAYASGFNLAESYYMAIPFLSWQTIVIGDPLCRPFAATPLPQAEITKGMDPDAEMPGLFTERRMALLSSTGGLNPAALKMLLRKDARVARGEAVDVEEVLIAAATLEPRLVAAHAQLAILYDGQKAYDKAIDRYRRIVALVPDDIMALNNLAYTLAEHGGAAKEALSYAERAYRVSKQAPLVTDTLGWVYHRMGDNLTAAAYLEQALRALPTHPDVLIHAATVHAALKDFPRARNELLAASKLGSAVTDREDYKALAEVLLKP